MQALGCAKLPSLKQSFSLKQVYKPPRRRVVKYNNKDRERDRWGEPIKIEWREVVDPKRANLRGSRAGGLHAYNCLSRHLNGIQILTESAGKPQKICISYLFSRKPVSGRSDGSEKRKSWGWRLSNRLDIAAQGDPELRLSTPPLPFGVLDPFPHWSWLSWR